MPFATKMDGPRDYHTQRNVRLRKTDVLWYYLYVESKNKQKMIKMNLIKNQKQIQRLKKQTYGYQKGRRRRGKLDKLRVWDKQKYYYIKNTKMTRFYCINSVQSLSPVRLFATPWTAAHQASLSITNSPSLPKPMSNESVMPSSHLILCRPLLLLPPIFPRIRVFSNESTLHIRWPKYWSFSFSISPSNEQPRTDLLEDGLVGSPCSPRDSQESSPTPQFKSINSSALSFLCISTLTSIHDYWKNHSLY